MIRRRRCACPRPRPTSARALTAWRPRWHCTGAWRSRRPVSSPSRAICRSRAGARTSLACETFDGGCIPRTASPSASARRFPLSGGLGFQRRGDRRGPDGRRPPVRAGRRPVGAGDRAGGHPDNVAAALRGGFVVLRRRRGGALRGTTGLEALAVVPDQAVGTLQARAALPAEVPLERPCSPRPHSAAHARPCPRRLGPGGARPARPPARVSPRVAVPRSYELALRASELAPWARRSQARGPRCSCGASTSRPARRRALRGEIDGWATLLRTPFEPQGAYVGSFDPAARALRR